MGYFRPRIRHPRRSERMIGTAPGYHRARERNALRETIAESLTEAADSTESPRPARETAAPPTPETTPTEEPTP